MLISVTDHKDRNFKLILYDLNSLITANGSLSKNLY